MRSHISIVERSTGAVLSSCDAAEVDVPDVVGLGHAVVSRTSRMTDTADQVEVCAAVSVIRRPPYNVIAG